MRYSSLILALSIGVFCIPSSDGLECWICSSLINTKCSEDGFIQEKSNTILKADCATVNSPSPSGPIPRRVNATTCLKNVVTTLTSNRIGPHYCSETTGTAMAALEKTIVSRGCASPGDYGIADATNEGCSTLKYTEGKSATSQTCLCTGDYCNGAQIQTITTFLSIVVPFALFWKDV